MSEKGFPEGFLWGSAGAAHQTEGNNTNNDWWVHEHTEGSPAKEPSVEACDSYHRFDEDWKLVASSGQNAVRFSIEWARIEPSPGEFSTRELDHYREVIGSARDLGLNAFVTFHHFTNPIWFAEGGSWETSESVEMFRRYVSRASNALGDLLEFVNTINEPQIVASLGYLAGYFPPRKTDMALSERVHSNLIQAHQAAASAVRSETDAQVGVALAINDYVSDDKQLREYTHRMMVGQYLDALRESDDDFVGVQYYTKVDPARPFSADREDERVTQMGWLWHPEGLGKVLDEVAALGLPIYITENGIATEDDEERIEYVTLHLDQVHQAIGRGADMRGYFYWSTLDNFEWNFGYRPKFGLIAVDRSTLERTPKPSLSWYGSVAKANALT
jgi:beta-glucosidase